MTTALQTLSDGLLLGGLYLIVALGLSLVFGVLGLINLSHGGLITAGAFLSLYIVDELGIDPLLSLVVVAPLLFGVGFVMQRVLLSPLMERGPDAPLVATFGLLRAIEGVLAVAFSADPRSLDASWATTGLSIAGLHLRVAYLIALVIALAMTIGVHLILTRTHRGIQVRAAARDPETASALGIDVRRVYAVTVGVSAMMAAVGGVMIGVSLSFTPASGLDWMLKGFTVVVLGGIGSLTGTVVCALGLGVLEAAGAEVIGGSYRDLVIYAAFLAVLVIRPTGLFGRPA